VFSPSLDEFECQGPQGTKNALNAAITPPAVYEWYALAANIVEQWQMAPFRPCLGVISGVCVRCMFGKTSLALVVLLLH